MENKTLATTICALPIGWLPLMLHWSVTVNTALHGIGGCGDLWNHKRLGTSLKMKLSRAIHSFIFQSDSFHHATNVGFVGWNYTAICDSLTITLDRPENYTGGQITLEVKNGIPVGFDSIDQLSDQVLQISLNGSTYIIDRPGYRQLLNLYKHDETDISTVNKYIYLSPCIDSEVASIPTTGKVVTVTGKFLFPSTCYTDENKIFDCYNNTEGTKIYINTTTSSGKDFKINVRFNGYLSFPIYYSHIQSYDNRIVLHGDNYGTSASEVVLSINGVNYTSNIVNATFTNTYIELVDMANKFIAGMLTVNVTVNNNTRDSPYTVALRPVLKSVTPSSIPTTGGEVTIVGEYLTDTDDLDTPIMSANASGFQCSDVKVVRTAVNTITCLMSPGQGKNLTLSVVVNGQSSTSGPQLSYYPPIIEGYKQIGTTIVLTGNNLGVDPTTSFAYLDANTNCAATSINQTTMTVNASSTETRPLSIIVNIAGQDSNTLNNVQLSPLISNITSAPTQGGDATVTGYFFHSSANVSISGIGSSIASAVLEKGTEIVIHVPAGCGIEGYQVNMTIGELNNINEDASTVIIAGRTCESPTVYEYNSVVCTVTNHTGSIDDIIGKEFNVIVEVDGQNCTLVNGFKYDFDQHSDGHNNFLNQRPQMIIKRKSSNYRLCSLKIVYMLLIVVTFVEGIHALVLSAMTWFHCNGLSPQHSTIGSLLTAAFNSATSSNCQRTFCVLIQAKQTLPWPLHNLSHTLVFIQILSVAAINHVQS
eukprot:gene15473-18368_t